MPEINYDESAVRAYVLPDIAGKAVKSADWWNFRREELRRLIADNMFGELPPRAAKVEFIPKSEKTGVLGGAAVRREITLRLTGNNGASHEVDILWYLPVNAVKCPAFVALNFWGNFACSDDADIPPPRPESVYPEVKRGENAFAWPFDYLIGKGFSVITAMRDDFFPDRLDGRKDSIYKLSGTEGLSIDEQNDGSISAWARGMCYLLDCLSTDPAIDMAHIYAHGHSRLGKTALWAAANDLRFAGAVSNNSGCCGASLSRRNLGETVESITGMFPWWFRGDFKRFAGNEDQMPFDQHMLLALLAPRPLLVASAQDDAWADPRGEFLATFACQDAYRLLGGNGLGGAREPRLNEVIEGDNLGYFFREGKHRVALPDWQVAVEFFARCAGEATR